jgi:hypothetical protein
MLKLILITIFFLLLPTISYTTTLGVDYIPLEDLISRANVIVEVIKKDPFAVQESIKIHSDTKKYPPYSHILHNYRITGILYTKDPSLSIGQELIVKEAYFSSNLKLHKMYYLEGIGKSPIHQRYQTKLDLFDLKNDKLILFLNTTEKKNMFTYAAEFSYEDYSKETEIKNIIAMVKISH